MYHQEGYMRCPGGADQLQYIIAVYHACGIDGQLSGLQGVLACRLAAQVEGRYPLAADRINDQTAGGGDGKLVSDRGAASHGGVGIDLQAE